MFQPAFIVHVYICAYTYMYASMYLYHIMHTFVQFINII